MNPCIELLYLYSQLLWYKLIQSPSFRILVATKIAYLVFWIKIFPFLFQKFCTQFLEPAIQLVRWFKRLSGILI